MDMFAPKWIVHILYIAQLVENQNFTGFNMSNYNKIQVIDKKFSEETIQIDYL